MRYLACIAWALAAALTCAPAGAQLEPGSYVEGQVVIAFEEVAARADLEASARSLGATLREFHADAALGVMEFAAGTPLAQAIKAAEGLPGVRLAQPNYIYRIPPIRKTLAGPPPEVGARFTPNDPNFAKQWHMAAVGAQAAWDIERGDPSVVIAVVDTGIAYRDGEGVRRMEDLATTRFVPGWDFIDDDATPDDLNGHGTHVAGTIAQATNNGIGVTGLAHGCSIMPVRALGSDGVGNTITVARAVKWAVENGADVVNLSLGASSGGQVELEMLQAASQAGAVLVAAAGNAGTASLDFPASSPYVIAVGAVQLDRSLAPYSNYGPGLDLVAPGGNLDLDQNADGASDGVCQNAFFTDMGDAPTDTDKYYYVEGTSQASPHVAATVGLLLSAGLSGSPRLDAAKAILASTADDLGPAGPDSEFGAGMVRADRALAALGSVTLYSISGRITLGGVGLQGVTVTAGRVSDTTDANGRYALPGLAPGTHTVKPTKTGLRFLPASRTVQLSGNVNSVNFEATLTLASAMEPGLRIVSVPVDPSADYDSAAAIFGAGVSALYTYSPRSRTYAAVTGEPSPGKAYFIRVPNKRTASVQGTIPSGEVARVTMPAGYNLLGSMRATTPLRLTDLRFEEGGSVLSYDQAVNGGAIRAYGWVYDSSSSVYRLLHPTLNGAAHAVAPWNGFFLEALRPVTALVPAYEAVETETRAAAEGYVLQLTVGGAACTIAELEGRPTALAAPPNPGEPAMVQLLPVPGSAEGIELRLSALENAPLGPYTLKVDGLEALPRRLTALLTDRATGRTISLRNRSWLELPSLEGERTVVLRILPRALSLGISIDTVAAARGVATVHYRVTAPAEVSAVVLNQAGRVVATLEAGTMEPGVHSLSWSGRSDRGTAVPAGEYRIEVRAESESRETARASARVSWQGGL